MGHTFYQRSFVTTADLTQRQKTLLLVEPRNGFKNIFLVNGLLERFPFGHVRPAVSFSFIWKKIFPILF